MDDSTLDELKKKPNLSREDIAKLFKSLGKPGENQQQKLEALRTLNKQNRQGHDLELTVESYGEY